MTDYGLFGAGGASYPLATGTGNSLLRDADPTIFFALDFFASMINTEIGARLVAEASACGAPITSGTPSAISFDPMPWLVEFQAKMPLLAVYRKNAKLTSRTVALRHNEGDIGITYVLPPLTAGQAERLMPALKAVCDVLDNRGEQGWDPSYTPPGGALGGSVWKAAGIESFVMTGAEWGQWSPTGNLTFPALRCDCAINELASATFATKFAGADISLDVVGGDQTVLSSVVQVATQQAPVPVSILPATGTAAGGTPVVLTAQNLVVGTTPIVTIAGAFCTNVVVTSPTTLTALTGPHAPIVGDIVIIGADMQRGPTLAAAFTYA